jgi:hypothetical protein
MGDFNFIWSQENRNMPGGDVNDIFLFNETISHLGLIALPLKGRSFTDGIRSIENKNLLRDANEFKIQSRKHLRSKIQSMKMQVMR